MFEDMILNEGIFSKTEYQPLTGSAEPHKAYDVCIESLKLNVEPICEKRDIPFEYFKIQDSDDYFESLGSAKYRMIVAIIKCSYEEYKKFLEESLDQVHRDVYKFGYYVYLLYNDYTLYVALGRYCEKVKKKRFATAEKITNLSASSMGIREKDFKALTKMVSFTDPDSRNNSIFDGVQRENAVISESSYYLEQIDVLNEGIFHNYIMPENRIDPKKAYEKAMKTLHSIEKLKFNQSLKDKAFGNNFDARECKMPSDKAFQKFANSAKGTLDLVKITFMIKSRKNCKNLIDEILDKTSYLEKDGYKIRVIYNPNNSSAIYTIKLAHIYTKERKSKNK